MRKNALMILVGVTLAVSALTFVPKIIHVAPKEGVDVSVTEEMILPERAEVFLEENQPRNSKSATEISSINLLGMDMSEAQIIGNPVFEAKINDVKHMAPSAPHRINASDIAVGASFVWNAPTVLAESYGGYNTGGSLTIETFDATSGAITLSGFPAAGMTVNATINFEKGQISIPYQVVGFSSSYGNIAFGDVSTTKPDRNTPVIAQINEDGTITIAQWWCLFVDNPSSSNNDALFGAWYKTVVKPANSTMLAMRYTNGQISSTQEIPIIATQTGKNTVVVENYLGGGQPIEFLLNENKTVTVNSQFALGNGYGSWVTIGNISIGEDGKVSYSGNFTSGVQNSAKTINLKSVGLLTTGYYDGPYDLKINFAEDLEYPTLNVTEFQGEGTASNPYKISTLDDLILLANKVNSSEDYNGSSALAKYARVYMNTYFEMTADIDMAGYQFMPIGGDWYHHFAGIFDGKGHKIQNLNSKAVSGQYAGLFGRTDTISVVKNINFENVNLINSGTNAAAPIAWSLGVVDNINSTNVTINAAGQGAGGVVGLAQTVTNCTAKDINIYAGMGFAGGIAGETDVLIQNCTASNINISTGVTAGYPYGGVSGSLYKASALNCNATVTIDGYSNHNAAIMGGIAGTASLATIDQCFAVVSITGYGSDAFNGGIIGRLIGSKLTNSYSSGHVNGYSSKHTGGLTGTVYDYSTAGPKSEVKSCYTSAYIQAETYLYVPENEYRETLGQIGDITTGVPSEPIIENIYFDNQIVNFGSTHYGVNSAFLTSASGIEGFDPGIWTFTEGQYPRLSNSATQENALYSASALLMSNNNSLAKVTTEVTLTPMGNTVFAFYMSGKLNTQQGHYASIKDNKLIPNDQYEAGTDTLFVLNGKSAYWMPVKIVPIPFDGNGTEDDPYLIQTAEDLVNLSNITTKAGQLFPGTYFKMTNDIDLNYTPDFVGICTNADDAHNTFSGIFDGGGFTIHKMMIGRQQLNLPDDPYKTAPSGKGYQGFIGRLAEDGVLKNINFASDCDITGWATMGAAVGYLYGTVENVRNYADVTGYSCWIGGIVGQAQGKVSVIRNCYNAGNVTTGYNCVGGIVGSSYSLIENCMNTGDVSAKSISCFNNPGSNKLNNAGGISGTTYGTVAINCINTGTVYAEYNKAGGLFASFAASSSGYGNNDAMQCLNYGEVYVTYDISAIGAIASSGGTKGEVVNVYYDSELLPIGALGVDNPLTIKGVSTSELTSGKPLTGFSADVWDFTAGMYPVLKQYADEPKVIEARKIIVNFGEGSNAFDVTKNATLASQDGLTWKLETGKYFTIEGSTLVPSYPFEETVQDVLIATYGSVVKPILIKGIPAVPLLGSGTEEDPYQLGSATDWNNLSDYMTSANRDFNGYYFKVMNDFSFGGENPAFKPLAADGVNFLNFTLDGNSKTISGIQMTTDNTVQAPIGTIGLFGYIHDLTLEGNVTSAKASTGGFSAVNYGVLENCVNAVNVTSTQGTAAGFAVQTRGNAKYINCVNKATIQGTGTVAGFTNTMYNDGGRVQFIGCTNEGTIKATAASPTYISGFVSTSYPCDFTDCVNNGKFEGTGPTAQYVAGLIGSVNGYAGAQAYSFKNCGNNTDIQGKAYIGGLLGNVITTANAAPINMDGCYNTGNIYNSSSATVSSSSGGWAAGLTGRIQAGSTITNCYNTGEIRSDKVVYAGGLFAYNATTGNATTTTLIKDCYNTGRIIADGNQGAGIWTYMTAYTTVENCWNSGEITGGFGLGGIIGSIAANSVVNNCYNLAPITTTQNRAAGIVAWGSQATSSITNCWNVGDITSTNETPNNGYATAGIAGNTSAKIMNCYNMGTIKGNYTVGGILGRPVKGTATNVQSQIINCYNAGEIIAPVGQGGPVIGVNTNGDIQEGYTASYWSEFNVIDNCYYAIDMISDDVAKMDQVTKASTLSELTETEISDAFVSPGFGCLPVITGYQENAAALAYSVIPYVSPEETINKVTDYVILGHPAGVSWTFNNDNVQVDDYYYVKYTGSLEEMPVEIEMTAAAGEYSHTWNVTLDAVVTGIDNLDNDGRIVDTEDYYDMSGVKVKKPENGDGQVYIVITRYSDGTTATRKVINVK